MILDVHENILSFWAGMQNSWPAAAAAGVPACGVPVRLVLAAADVDEDGSETLDVEQIPCTVLSCHQLEGELAAMVCRDRVIIVSTTWCATAECSRQQQQPQVLVCWGGCASIESGCSRRVGWLRMQASEHTLIL